MADTEKSGWKCERCLNAGVIAYAKDASIYDVFNQFHDAHRAASGGECVDLDRTDTWPIPENPNG